MSAPPGRILDGVAEDVEQGCLQFVGVAAHDHGKRGLFDAKGNGFFFEVVTREGDTHAFFNEGAHVHGDADVGAGR